VLQPPFWTIDYAYNPAPLQTCTSKSWRGRPAGSRGRNTPYGRPAWYVMVFAEQSERIADLEAAGFTCQADVGEDFVVEGAAAAGSANPGESLQAARGF